MLTFNHLAVGKSNEFLFIFVVDFVLYDFDTVSLLDTKS